MWFFKKREKQNIIKLIGFTDYHSHILPGVDDGVQTMDESLEILRLYEEQGIKSVWLTPHIMEDIPNTTAHLRDRFAELQAAYTGGVQLHLAAENMLDNLFEERLGKNDLLPLGENGDHLLVETSYFSPPMGLKNILLRIKSKGYHPVLAHPERYAYMDESDYRQLKDMGVKFQINLPSIAGMYGNRIKKKAMFLMREQAIAYIGTDIHSYSIFQKFIGKSYLHVTTAVLSQFAHFSGLAISPMQRPLYELRVELDCFCCTFFVHTANDTVVMYQLINHIARKYTLGAIGDINFTFQFRTLSEN